MRKSFARLQAFNEHMIQQGISCFLFKPADVNQYTPNELNEQHFPIGADAVKENQTVTSVVEQLVHCVSLAISLRSHEGQSWL